MNIVSLIINIPQRVRWLSENVNLLGGSPGLVVMGGDSYSEGHGFES